MSMKSVKLLAATVLVTCGIGLGVGAGWLGTAAAQPASKKAAATDPFARDKLLQDEANRQRQAAEKEQRQAGEAVRSQQEKIAADLDALILLATRQHGETYTAKTTKWEYDFVEVSDMGTTKFVEFLQDRENRGWEFNGQTTLKHASQSGAVWIFRRPGATGVRTGTPNPDPQRACRLPRGCWGTPVRQNWKMPRPSRPRSAACKRDSNP